MKVLDPVATGQNIKTLMRSKGKTANDVMLACDLSTTNAIYRWFQGRPMPTLDHVVILADLLEVAVDEIIITMEVDL